MARFYLSDLATAARKSGLKVVEVAGWKTRGRPTGKFGKPVAIIIHHTASSQASKDSAVTNLLVKGRSDLPGPLSQLGLGRDGTVYVIAAGRSNHAGQTRKIGPFKNKGDGNENTIGIEAYNSGYEGWTSAQLNAYHRLCAALLDHYGLPRDRVYAHAETSTTGKWDPGVGGRVIDMAVFRKAVWAVGRASTTPPKPVVLGKGDRGQAVVELQRALNKQGAKIAADGIFGSATDAAVRAFQRKAKLGVDGLAGPNTFAALEKANAPKPKPEPKPAPGPQASWFSLYNVTGDRYSDGKNLGGGWAKRGPKVAKHNASLGASMRIVNEVTSTAMTRSLIGAMGTNFDHDGSAYGNDLFYDEKKFRILNSKSVKIGSTGRTFEFLEMHRQADGKRFNLIIVHLPARNPVGRASDMKFILGWVRGFKDPTIIAGDLNNWSEYSGSPRAHLRSAGFKASRDQTKRVVRGDTDEMDATKKVVTRAKGRWVSDFYTKGCTITDVELVLNPTSTYSTHHAFKARIAI